jgi:hypothetical protein
MGARHYRACPFPQVDHSDVFGTSYGHPADFITTPALFELISGFRFNG